jgi:hypothetical protein
MIWLLDAEHFAPHGACLLWDPTLVPLTIVANIAIALAYLAIPLQLTAVLRMKSLLPNWAVMLFMAFIVLCGVGHGIEVLTLFRPYYWLQVVENALTAVVSVSTAVLLPVAIIHHN